MGGRERLEHRPTVEHEARLAPDKTVQADALADGQIEVGQCVAG